MTARRIFCQRVEDQARLRCFDGLDRLHTGGADQLGCVFRDLLARFDNDLARPI